MVGKRERLDAGVYAAVLAGMEPEMRTVEKWPYPKATIKFKVGGQSPVWSIDVGIDLALAVRMLTGYQIPVEVLSQDHSIVFHAALQAMQDKMWSGQVRVDNNGYVDQPALAGGHYFRFFDITSRASDGQVGPFTYTNQKTGKEISAIFHRSEVVSGPYAGWVHRQYLKVSPHQIGKDRKSITWDDRAAVYHWASVVAGDAKVEFPENCENPWPIVVAGLQGAARRGHVFFGWVDEVGSDYPGSMYWSGLKPVQDKSQVKIDFPYLDLSGVSQYSSHAPSGDDTHERAALVQSLMDRMKAVAATAFPDLVVFNEDISFTPDGGKLIASRLLGVINGTLPHAGMKAVWPPSSPGANLDWGVMGMRNAVEILHHFENMDKSQLDTFLGEGCVETLTAHLKEVFPQFLTPQVVATKSDGEKIAEAVPF
jgi:hypothetical protein